MCFLLASYMSSFDVRYASQRHTRRNRTLKKPYKTWKIFTLLGSKACAIHVHGLPVSTPTPMRSCPTCLAATHNTALTLPLFLNITALFSGNSAINAAIATPTLVQNPVVLSQLLSQLHDGFPEGCSTLLKRYKITYSLSKRE